MPPIRTAQQTGSPDDASPSSRKPSFSLERTLPRSAYANITKLISFHPTDRVQEQDMIRLAHSIGSIASHVSPFAQAHVSRQSDCSLPIPSRLCAFQLSPTQIVLALQLLLLDKADRMIFRERVIDTLRTQILTFGGRARCGRMVETYVRVSTTANLRTTLD